VDRKHALRAHASGDRFGRFFRRLTLITAKGFVGSFFSLPSAGFFLNPAFGAPPRV